MESCCDLWRPLVLVPFRRKRVRADSGPCADYSFRWKQFIYARSYASAFHPDGSQNVISFDEYPSLFILKRSSPSPDEKNGIAFAMTNFGSKEVFFPSNLIVEVTKQICPSGLCLDLLSQTVNEEKTCFGVVDVRNGIRYCQHSSDFPTFPGTSFIDALTLQRHARVPLFGSKKQPRPFLWTNWQ